MNTKKHHRGRHAAARPHRWAAAGAALLLAILAVAAPAAAATLAVRDVRLFDGERVLPRATVVVTDGVITAVGEAVEPPADAEIVDGRGKTLLPGLIDAHTHCWDGALERSLAFGVTTDIDMFSSYEWDAAMRSEQAAGSVYERADLVSAGTLVTAPGGHGTQFGLPIPTLTEASAAQEFVDARLAEGSDFIKTVYEDGSLYGRELPTLSQETLAAVIAAAHRRDVLAVVHISRREAARQALQAGADGLVHLFIDAPPDDAFIELAKRSGAFVIPTLTVLESTTGKASGASLVEDERLAAYLLPAEAQNLRRGFPERSAEPLSLEPALQTVRRLLAAGVPVLAGSDAPNPGTTHGASVHRELELLVRAGLSPTQALAAATSVPADAFGLDDRGRIAPGKVGDLLLVDGDPTADVTASRAIVAIFRRSHRVEREAVAQDGAAAAEAVPARQPGLVSDFEGEALSAAYGFGWQSSTDAMLGGKSTVELSLVEGGAGDSGGALQVAGTIVSGSMFPWAGAMFFPGEQPMAPVDLSAAHELVFKVRGDGGSYRVLLFATSLGRIPAQRSFDTGEAWTEVVMPLSGFGVDGSDLSAILFTGGVEAGEFRFQIDDVSFR